MQLIRGTTPTIVINVKTEIDLHNISEVWVYISQQNKVKVDKLLKDVSFNYIDRQIIVTLSQEDTLSLKKGDAIIQIRCLLNNGEALANIAKSITVEEVYKGGVIEPESNEVNDNG